MYALRDAFTALTESILFYPITFLQQAYAVIVAGSGKIRAAVLAIKACFLAERNPIAQIPLALASIPPQAAVTSPPHLDTGSRRPGAEEKWSAFENKCLALIDKKYLDESDKADLKSYYQKVLSRLLDEETGGENLKRTAALAEKFHIRFNQSELKEALDVELKQQSGRSLQQKWQELARINFHLCVTLSGFATLKELARYGVDRDFLLGLLPTDRAQAEAFFDSMETPSKSAVCRNTALSHAISEGFGEVVSDLLKADPGCADEVDENGMSILMQAACEEDIDKMRLLLQHDINVNLQSYGYTALIYACRAQTHSLRKEMINILLKYGADVDLKGKNGRTALMEACAFSREFAEVKLLLNKSTNSINAQDKHGQTALMVACKKGTPEAVQLLLKYGADTEIKNQDGEDALAIAGKKGNDNVIQLLKIHKLRQHPLPDSAYTFEQRKLLNRLSIFIDKIGFNQTEINANRSQLKKRCEMMLSHLLDPSTDDKYFRHIVPVMQKFYRHLSYTEMEKVVNKILSAPKGRRYVLTAQLEKIASLDLRLCFIICCLAEPSTLAKYGVQDRGDALLARVSAQRAKIDAFLRSMGEESLDISLSGTVNKKFLESISIFLQANPDCIDTPDKHGETALMRATGDRRGIDTICLLLARNADVNRQDRLGQTSLFIACYKEQIDIVRLLLQYNAEVNITDNDGVTPLMNAVDRGNIELARLLLEHGADINARTVRGFMAGSTALMRAGSHKEMADLLLQHGAEPNTNNRGRKEKLSLLYM